MQYFFDGKIKEADGEYFIPIPFNVWEVCKKRDVIDGEIIMDNRMIRCELLPKEKGNYEIHLTKEEVADFDLEKTHKIVLHIGESLIRMDQNSPYSVDNPIRKIDSIDVIIQPEDGLCGQACVAMLAGVTIAEVMSVMDCREWQATMGMVISALNYYGIDHNKVIIYTEGKPAVLPKCCIMMEKMGRFCHYLIHFDGKFYDSNLGVFEEYDMSKLLGYFEVNV